MNNQDKSKKELLYEIQRLEQINQQVKASYEKEISDFKLEKELVETKMLSFEAVCESSPVPMLIIDETTNIVMANLAAIRLSDCDEVDVLNHRPGNALRCIHSSKDPRGCGYSADCKICALRNSVESLIAKGGSIHGAELEMSLIRNGKMQKVWMNVGVEPMMMGGIKHWCVALNDISKYKYAVASFIESEARFREVLENSMDASYKRNLQTNKYDYLSPVFGQIAGYTQDELSELSSEIIWEQIHSEDLLEMDRVISGAISDSENKSYQIEYRFRHNETGEYRWLYDKFTVMHDALGKSIALIGSVGDITARKETEKELNDYKENLEKLITERTESLHREIELRTMTEEALRESEVKYRNIVDYSTSIVLEWDTEGKVLFVNKYGLDFFGFVLEEILGQNVTGTIVQPFDSEGNDLEGKMKVIQMKPEDFYSSENENVRKNGEKVWIAWTNKGLYDADGRLIKTLSVGIDRTKQHELEKSLQNYRGQLEKMVEARTQELTLTNQQLVEEIKVRKKVEDSLKENERMLLESQNIARLGTFELDIVSEVFTTSAILDEIYGIDQYYSKTIDGWFGLIHPDDRDMIHDYFRNEVIAKGRPFDNEFRIIRFNDKSIRWVHSIAKSESQKNINKLIGTTRDITAQKEAEVALRESEEKFRLSFMTGLDAFYVATLEEGRITDANQVFEDVFGYSHDEVIGKTSLELNLYNDPADRAAMVKELKANGFVKDLELKGRKKDGTQIMVSISVSVTKLENRPYVIGVIRDITMRKQTEKLLELNTFRIEALLKLNQMAKSDLKEITDFALEQAVELTQSKIGYLAFLNEDESVMTMHSWSKSAMAECAIDDKPIIYPVVDTGLWGEAVRQRKPIITNDYAADNPLKKGYPHGHVALERHMNVPVFLGDRIVLVAGVGNKSEDYSANDANELILMMEGMWRLIERKRSEMELIETKEKAEASEFRLKLATASGQLGIWDWDVINNVMIWDDRMYELYGMTKDDFSNNNNIEAWIHGLHPEDKQSAIDALNAALAGTKDFDLSFRVLHPDKTVLYLKANGSVIIDAEGNSIRMIGINKDITESKQAEEQLMIAKEKAEESDRLKTAFLNNISHEIRTPLNGILGFASYIVQPNITQKEKEGYLSELTHSSFRLINTVTDFMDMSLIVSGNMHVNPQPVEMYSLMQILQQRFLGFSNEKKLELIIQQGQIPDGFMLKTDEELLMKLLSHLLSNAIKFTAKGNITIGFEFKSNELELFVRDTGIGVSDEYKDRIFDVFMQENVSDTRGYEGSGLGLSIAKGIAKLLGGTIRMESAKAVGTTVFVSFPVESNEIGKVDGITFNEKQIDKVSFLLIAEDDDASYLFIETVMKKYSDHIVRAANGKEAVDFCLNNPDIDMVLMDIKMPVMDGYEATRKIRQFNKNVIIIAQTAYGLAGDKNKAIEAGCNDYISKPINKDELYAIVLKRINA
jgi:PAS domain S-box-containing protein